MKISWWRTKLGEEEIKSVSSSIANEHISQGPVVEEFEGKLAEFLGVPYVVCTTSGSMALLMSLMALGVGPGDEVIVPNATWIATAHAVLMAGAKVRLVDVEKDRPIIDSDKIEENITAKTKAIMPVHLNGCSADIQKIREIANKHDLYVLEDAAQALGSRNSDGYLGTQSDVGCFSLSVAKIISTGQGGIIVTKDEGIYKTLKSIRTHGVTDIVNAKWERLGYNFRLTDILASIGLVQLRKLDDRIQRVKEIYERYRTAIQDMPYLTLLPVDVESGEIPIYVEVVCDERDRLMSYLAEKNIQTRPFYPAMHEAKYFGNSGSFPHTDNFTNNGFFLPSGPDQPLSNVDLVIDALRSFDVD